MRQVAIIVTTLLVGVGSAQAAELCARQRSDGTFNTSVKIREACRSSEITLDQGVLGLVGPQGPVGPAGPPIAPAAIYSREMVIVLPADANCPATSGADIGSVACDSTADALISCGALTPVGGGAVQTVVREDPSFAPATGSATHAQCVARGCSTAGGQTRVIATCVSASATTTTTTTTQPTTTTTSTSSTTTTTTDTTTTTTDTTTTTTDTTTTTTESTTTTT